MIGALFFLYVFLTGVALDVVSLQNPMRRYAECRRRRDISILHEWIDWLGGYRFEVAKPEESFDFYKDKGFLLQEPRSTGNMGVAQFVFQKRSE